MLSHKIICTFSCEFLQRISILTVWINYVNLFDRETRHFVNINLKQSENLNVYYIHITQNINNVLKVVSCLK